MDLTDTEIRVLGCLLEKQRTTPDVYPLTLNALRLACNQSTNRDPVLALGEDEIVSALRRLQRLGLARFTSGHGSRSSKYRHLLEEALPMGSGEQALLCVLMLRGVQTPGELKQRADRIHSFTELGAVLETLERLIERELVSRLSRRPGQKEERYEHLLGGGTTDDGSATTWRTEAGEDASGGGGEGAGAGHARPLQVTDGPPAGALQALAARVAALEREVATLRTGLGSEPAGSSEDPPAGIDHDGDSADVPMHGAGAESVGGPG